MLFSALHMALREIRRNAGRSILTALGIVIGVGAVIAMVNLGQAATNKVQSDISSLGNNMLIIAPGSSRRGPVSVSATPLRIEDVRAIEEQATALVAVAPTSSRSVLAVYGDKNYNTVVNGSTNAWFTVRSWKLEKGRTFSDVELQGGSPACILGLTVKKKLFGNQEAIGAVIRVKDIACTIVGILTSKGRSTFGEDQDDLLIMPLATVQRRIAGTTNIDSVLVSVAPRHSSTGAINQIQSLLRERRHIAQGQEDDFTVHDMKEIAKTLSSVTQALTALLGAIAAVSLIVGGIGIMNIMLVSVTERTREIGLRLAIGARARDVLLQFLVEAVMLSTLGGILGILVGLGGSFLATRALGMPFVFVPPIVVIAFLFSATVGIAFGYLPARRAARLNPVDALRHE